MEPTKLRKIVLLAGAVAATAASAGSLPSDGLQVHFRADDQAALNNGAGAAQWSDVTNWQGGGAAAPLLKQVEKPDGGLRKVPRFVTNGFERADGTFVVALFAAPGPTANAATSAATEPISFDSSAYAEDVGGPISFSSMPTGLFIIFS